MERQFVQNWSGKAYEMNAFCLSLKKVDSQ